MLPEKEGLIKKTKMENSREVEGLVYPILHKEREFSLVFWKVKMHNVPLGIRKDKRRTSHIIESVWNKFGSADLKSRQATSI